MENQQWTAEYQQQSVVMSVERTDESSNNGICDNLLEDAGKGSDQCSTNGICDSNSRMQVIEAAIRLIFIILFILDVLLLPLCKWAGFYCTLSLIPFSYSIFFAAEMNTVKLGSDFFLQERCLH